MHAESLTENLLSGKQNNEAEHGVPVQPRHAIDTENP
jgi:hypothetical protein